MGRFFFSVLSLLILLTSQSIWAMSCVDLLAKEERLFPNFRYDPQTLEYTVYWALRNKWIDRLVMEGGPLAQPEYFYLINYPKREASNGRLNGGRISENVGVAAEFMGKNHVMEVDAVAESIISQSLSGSWVLKPTGGTWGRNVVILRRESKSFVATLIVEEGLSALTYLDSKRYEREATDNGNVVHYRIPAEKQNIRDLIDVLFDPAKNEFGLNSGMIEAYVDSVKLNGQVYETRHVVSGQLDQKRVEKIVDSHARVGESGWFTNQWSLTNKEKAFTLHGEEMFNPLVEAGVVKATDKVEFVEYVHQKLKEAYIYYANRMRKEGFVFGGGPSSLQIDLMWLPPREGEKFPTPVLIELEWHYKNPKMYDLPGSLLGFEETPQ